MSEETDVFITVTVRISRPMSVVLPTSTGCRDPRADSASISHDLCHFFLTGPNWVGASGSCHLKMGTVSKMCSVLDNKRWTSEETAHVISNVRYYYENPSKQLHFFPIFF
jgi:hypothetical protein